MSFIIKHSLIIVLLSLSVLTWCSDAYFKVGNSKPFFLFDRYDVYITNNEVDNLMVHCKSNDDDLGDKNLVPGQYFHWGFRQNFLFTTHFWCNFRSMTSDDQEIKSITFDVFDLYISTKCGPGDPKHCYWLAKNDGFYFSMDDKPFPDGWVLRKKW